MMINPNEMLQITEEPIDYDPQTETHRLHFDSTTVAPFIAVVEMMGDICGNKVTQLTPLYDVVDTEVLNQQMVQSRGRQESDCIVEFEYHGHRVTVKGCGIIEAQPLSTDSDAERDT